METNTKPYTANLTYEEILSFPANLIDRWAFDQTYLQTAGSIEMASKSLSIPYLRLDDLQYYLSEDLLSWLWLETAPDRPTSKAPSELPLPEPRYLEYYSQGLDAFRLKYCLDLLDRFDGSKIAVCRSLKIEEWKLNRFLRPTIWIDEDDSADDWYRDSVSQSRAVKDHDSSASNWIDIRDRGIVDADDARFMVDSGKNYQLDLVADLEVEVAEILAKHRGGLCFNLNEWTPEIAEALSELSGTLSGFIDFESFFPAEESAWDEPFGNRHRWYSDLLRKLVQQGETDFRWVRHLTARQADILLESKASRLVLPNLKRAWNVEPNGTGSLEKFAGDRLLVLTEEPPKNEFIQSACRWGGSLICNWPLSPDHPVEKLASLWHANEQLESDYSPAFLDRLSSIPGSVHLDFGYQPMQKRAAEALLKRKTPTYIEGGAGCRPFFPNDSSVQYTEDADPRLFDLIASDRQWESESPAAQSTKAVNSVDSDSVLLSDFLDLSSHHEVNESVARVLAMRERGVVLLDGLREIDDSVAELLGKIKGKVTLRGLEYLSDKAAIAFSKSDCELKLLASTRLTEKGVTALQGKDAHVSIEYSVHLRDTDSKHLNVNFPFTAGDLMPGNRLIIKDQAGLNATFLLREIEATRVLSRCDAIDAIKLTVEGLTRIYESNAEDLAKFKGLDLCFPDTKEINPGALAKLANFQGQWIYLPEELAQKNEVVSALGRLLPQENDC